MKNLYPKGKGKIHPSPSYPALSDGGGDALAVLSLLPAAIQALAAALGAEDREVLAYLVTRSLKGPWSVVGEGGRRCRRQQQSVVAGLHQPLFDCGCFDCYISFWFRWDSSPDRELIHQAIEAFEEHLASSEQRRAGGRGGRRRKRRLGGDRSEKTKEAEKKDERKMKQEKEKASAGGGGEEEDGVSGREASSKQEETEEVYDAAEQDEGGGEAVGERDEEVRGSGMETVAVVHQQVPGSGGGERRKGWFDVTGFFNSRLWSLWSPSACDMFGR